jgi:hypothetical protein
MQRQGVQREANALGSVVKDLLSEENASAECTVLVVAVRAENETEISRPAPSPERQSLCFDGSIIGGAC